MIHLTNFILKSIATLLLAVIGVFAVMISIIMWNSTFILHVNEMEHIIWDKTRKNSLCYRTRK